MAIFIGIALALLSIGVCVYPFLKLRSSRVFLQEPAAPEPDAGPTLESINDAMNTLNLEFQLGNIPQGLFLEQMNDYQAQMEQIMRSQSLVRSQSVDQALEWQITVEVDQLRQGGLRRRRARSTYRPPQVRTCSSCGAPLNPALTQCPVCSVQLPPATSPAEASQE